MPRLLVAAACLCMALPVGARAQDWPLRPVNLVVPFAAGGPVDTIARILAARLGDLLGQQVIVENIGGAGGMTGAARVAKAPPDGYTVLLSGSATLAINQTLYKRPLYNAVTDFEHVALFSDSARVLISRRTLPVDTLPAFVAFARSSQAGMQYGSAGAGSGSHVCAILLDLAIYFQHVTFHAVPTLWRLHRVHHADVHVDVTTGTRFHPVEILISTLVKCAAVAAIGAPAAAVLAFEILLNATAVFNHANARLPERLDRVLRRLVVTPDMHRVHHSIEYDESSSNFGFNLPWWDRLFGTYRAQPRLGHEAMTLGVDAFRSAQDLRLDRLLVQPLRDTPGQYPINRQLAA